MLGIERKAARLAALLLCAALCLTLAGCGGDDIQGAAFGDGARFTIAVAQQPDSLNPYVSEGGLSEEFFLLCYDPLWRINENGEAEPCLVEDWSLSSDRLTWTIRLRRDITFSDGHPLTAGDVQYSYELFRRSEAYNEYFDGISAIRCPDDYTVVISADYVKSDMLYNPTPIVPRHIWKNYEDSPASFENEDMIGSGPFIYCPEESGEEGWLFRSRADHFGERAQIGSVFFSYYGTVTGAARALAAGEADASFGLTDVQLTTLESVPGVRLIEAMLPGAECRGLVFNTRSVYFESAAMRQAVEYCADRDWFLLMSSGGTGMTGSSFVSPGAEYFSLPSSVRGYEPSMALSLFAGAGYTYSADKGTLVFRDGVPIGLTLYTSSKDEWASTAAAILTTELESVGVPVDWQKIEQPVAQVCTPKSSWDMCMVSWHGSLDAPLTAGHFYEEIGGLAGWTSPEYESVLAQLRSAESAASRNFAAQLQQKAYDECPVVVLSYGVEIQAVRDDGWIGFEEILDAAGGLFRIGSAAAYMKIAPAE